MSNEWNLHLSILVTIENKNIQYAMLNNQDSILHKSIEHGALNNE